MSKDLSRRQFLRAGAIGAAAALVAACQPKVVEVEKEITKVVEKIVKETVIVEGTPKVVEKMVTQIVKEVVTATPAPKEKVQVSFHTRTGRDGDFYLAEQALFHDVQDEIELVLEQTPNAEYQSKIATLAAGGDLGDAYWGNVFGQLYPFASAGIALDVKPLIDADPEVDLDNFFDVAIEQTDWNGKLAGLSMGIHPGWTTMYTNITLFEEAGAPLPKWEWKMLAEWLQAIQLPVKDKDGDGSIDQFGYMFDYSAQNTYTFIRCWGSDWVNPDDRKTSMVLADKTVEAISFMRDLVHKYKCSPRQEDLLDNMFINQYTASWSHGNWAYGQLKTNIADAFEWQGFPMPSGPGGRGSFIGCNTFCLNSSTKHVKEIFEVGKFVVTPESGIRAVKHGMTTPARKECWEDPILRDDPTLQATKQWLDVATAWTVPGNARALEFRNTFNQGISAVLNGENDFMTELKNLDAAIQGVLDKPAM